MQILLSNNAIERLNAILDRERVENPEAVFRIWEITRGRYNDAKIHLRLSVDEKDENDVEASCVRLPFVASRDFLALRGEPHIFYIGLAKNGMPQVQEFGV